MAFPFTATLVIIAIMSITATAETDPVWKLTPPPANVRKPDTNPHLTGTQNNVLETYVVYVPAVNKPASVLSKKAWHQGLLTTVGSCCLKASSNSTINGTAFPSVDKRMLYSYGNAYQGFAVRLTKDEAAALSKLPEVKTMFVSGRKKLHTTHSPEFLSLFTTNGSAISNGGSLFAAANGGSDVIVGLIDTGVWPESTSFNSDAGYMPIPAHWNGSCEDVDTFQGSVVCNKKLIGARTFYQGMQAYLENNNLTLEDIGEVMSPRDRHGHGTHTASTSVGNVVANAGFFNVYANGNASGMAPSARLAVYKACWGDYGCDDVDIIAAFDAAVSDGVDVISLSVGGYDYSYDTSSIALASFYAVEQGVTVVASAGNDGPSRTWVTNAAPWIVTVGASTVDRDFPATVTLGNGTVFEGSSLYAGELDLSNTSSPLVYGVYCTNATELQEIGAEGAVVLCVDGFISGADKGLVVKQAGGVGMVLVTFSNDVWSIVESFTIPTVYVRYNDGYAIYLYMLSFSEPSAKLQTGNTRLGKSVAVPAPAVATFSSRGPNHLSPELLKPDIIAPGVSILAAWSGASSPSLSVNDTRRSDFNIISGTSMSCPHVSGVVALLKAAHPTWTPAMLRSAITTTATTGNDRSGPILQLNNGVAASVLDMGAGHINPNAALDPGLVYDATTQDYVDFLCSLGYNNLSSFTNSLSCNPNSAILRPGDLNYPSFSVIYYSNNQTNSLTYTRTLTNVASGVGGSVYTVSVVPPYGVNVTVSPSTLLFNGTVGQKLSYSVTFTGAPSFFSYIDSSYVYTDGSITWSDNAGHNVRSPVVFIWQLVSS